MPPKACFLERSRTVVVVEIQTRFADPDHLWMAGEADQCGGRRSRLALHMMRMDADRAPDRGVRLGERADAGEPGHARADRLHDADSCAGRTFEDGIEIWAEVRKIEVAMAVDQHPRSPRPLRVLPRPP